MSMNCTLPIPKCKWKQTNVDEISIQLPPPLVMKTLLMSISHGARDGFIKSICEHQKETKYN